MGWLWLEPTMPVVGFSDTRPHGSFPFTEDETVSTFILLCVVALGPMVLIAAVSLVCVPGATAPQGMPRMLIWQRKLWELHAGWQGLAMALFGTWFVTSALQMLCGKPRPDFLARCQPDLANLPVYLVGGTANVSSNSQLVSESICQNPDTACLNDGFMSFPSGHSSLSAAGLVYLSLFFASKFAVTLPSLPTSSHADADACTAFPSRLPRCAPAARRQAAAPPLYLLVVALAPFGTAVFIASSRWSDFRHHGVDILAGFLVGTVAALAAFRCYHLPLARGAGWAWGPRSRDKAFWAGVGSVSYATDAVADRARADDWAVDEKLSFGGGEPGDGGAVRPDGRGGTPRQPTSWFMPAAHTPYAGARSGREEGEAYYMGRAV